jgi:hypothetical protein
VFLQDVSGKTGISVDALIQELLRTRMRSPVRQEEGMQTERPWPPTGTLTTLTEILVRNPEARESVFENWIPQEIKDERLQAVLTRLYEDWKSGRNAEPESILDHFTESPVRNFLTKCLLLDEEIDADKQTEIDLKFAADCLRSMGAAKLGGQIAALKQKLAATPDSAETLSELQDLMRQQKKLKHVQGPEAEEF